jgi:uracil-DNA glycosylase family 4
VHEANPGYFCRPVPPFGSSDARLVIVGLAPGMHGAKRDWPPVHRRLRGHPPVCDAARVRVRLAAGSDGARRRPGARRLPDHQRVKCLPPENKPAPAEIRNCNTYLAADLAQVPDGGAILALGRIAHEATLLALGRRRPEFPFAHGARHELSRGIAMFDSYHCSRYNTNTGRLTAPMFQAVFDAIAVHLRREGARRAA